MKPTIGRIVHFLTWQGKIVPAIIVAIWSDTCVNLRVFHDGSNSDLSWNPDKEWETSRTLDESAEPQKGTWHWPPKV